MRSLAGLVRAAGVPRDPRRGRRPGRKKDPPSGIRRATRVWDSGAGQPKASSVWSATGTSANRPARCSTPASSVDQCVSAVILAREIGMITDGG